MDLGIADRYRKVHATQSVSEVALGYRTVVILDPDGLDNAQVGYSRAPDGSDLTGPDDGAWRRSWVVVGHEDQRGDPLFVDTASGEWPVYTAMHGEGMWEPCADCGVVRCLPGGSGQSSRSVRGARNAGSS